MKESSLTRDYLIIYPVVPDSELRGKRIAEFGSLPVYVNVGPFSLYVLTTGNTDTDCRP